MASLIPTPSSVAESILQQCNAPQTHTIDAFLRPQQRVMAALLCRAAGGFAISSVIKQTDSEYEATLASQLLPEFQADLSLKMNGTQIVAATITPNPHVAVRPMQFRSIVEDVDTYFTRAAADGEFAGSVLIAKDDTPVLLRSYANDALRGAIPAGPETRYPIASMGKMFTAIAVAQLIHDGKLSYDSTLAQVLPALKAPSADKITIRMLLTHSSGLADIFGPQLRAAAGSRGTNDDFLKFAEIQPLLFAPGSSSAYSNLGYVVLGAVIQAVSGQSYEQYVAQHIWTPAGMTHTSFNGTFGTGSDAAAYEWQRNDVRELVAHSADPVMHASAAGGAWSTAVDMLHFARALQAGRLVPRDIVALMTTPKVQSQDGAYGYGFEISDYPGLHVYGHNGGTIFESTTLRVAANGKYTYVLFDMTPMRMAALIPTEFTLQELGAAVPF